MDQTPHQLRLGDFEFPEDELRRAYERMDLSFKRQMSLAEMMSESSLRRCLEIQAELHNKHHRRRGGRKGRDERPDIGQA